MSGGRYSKYEDSYPDLRIEMAKRCLSYHDFCSKIGISERTYRTWKKKNKKFREADEIARAAYASSASLLIKENLSNKDFNHYSAHKILALEHNQAYVYIDGFDEAESFSEKNKKVLDLLSSGQISVSQAENLVGIIERSQKILGVEQMVEDAMNRIYKLEEMLGESFSES